MLRTLSKVSIGMSACLSVCLFLFLFHSLAYLCCHCHLCLPVHTCHRESDSDNRKQYKYVCITTNQPETKSVFTTFCCYCHTAFVVYCLRTAVALLILPNTAKKLILQGVIAPFEGCNAMGNDTEFGGKSEIRSGCLFIFRFTASTMLKTLLFNLLFMCQMSLRWHCWW